MSSTPYHQGLIDFPSTLTVHLVLAGDDSVGDKSEFILSHQSKWWIIFTGLKEVSFCRLEFDKLWWCMEWGGKPDGKPVGDCRTRWWGRWLCPWGGTWGKPCDGPCVGPWVWPCVGPLLAPLGPCSGWLNEPPIIPDPIWWCPICPAGPTADPTLDDGNVWWWTLPSCVPCGDVPLRSWGEFTAVWSFLSGGHFVQLATVHLFIKKQCGEAGVLN